MRTWLLALIAGLTLSWMGCLTPAPIEGAQCNKDRRCPSGYFCQGARCHAGDPFVQSLLCEADEDCTNGALCHPVDGLCVQCHAPAHCLTGLCTMAGTCGTCEAAEDCAETGQCNAYGYCAACTSDAHCALGAACLLGIGQCAEEDRRDRDGSGRDGQPTEGP